VNENRKERDEKGFTLIELLIAIVVVGILAAVAIVGIGGLTATGNTAACKASKDSAVAASAAFYANSATQQWPADLNALWAATPKVWQTPNNTAPVTNVLTFGGWTLTQSGGGATQPTYVCGP
jgi:prepilin-type N-terminal cleavage/methylation domain-containing protein